jgi:hypothetical protein
LRNRTDDAKAGGAYVSVPRRIVPGTNSTTRKCDYGRNPDRDRFGLIEFFHGSVLPKRIKELATGRGRPTFPATLRIRILLVIDAFNDITLYIPEGSITQSFADRARRIHVQLEFRIGERALGH